MTTDELYNLDDITRFFSLLSHTPTDNIEDIPDVFSGYLMYESGKGEGKPIAKYAQLHGKAEGMLNYFAAACQFIESKNDFRFNKKAGAVRKRDGKRVVVKGACTPSLHIVLNQTNMQGRKLKDITGTRVLAVDIDRGIDREEIKEIVENYSPELVVQSSGDGDSGKYHLYWRIQNCDLETWRMFQLAFAHELGGDLMLDQANKTLRVPGFKRMKAGVVTTPTVVFMDVEGRPMLPRDVREQHEWVTDAYEAAQIERSEALKSQRKIAKKLLKGAKIAGSEVIKSSEVQDVVTKYGRNQVLYSTLSMTARRLSRDAVASAEATQINVEGISEQCNKQLALLARDLNESFPEPLDIEEVSSVLDKVIRKNDSWLENKAKAIIKNRQALVAMVTASDDDDDEPEDDDDALVEKKRKKKPELSIVQTVEASPEEPEHTVPFHVGKDRLIEEKVVDLPESILDAGKDFAEYLLERADRYAPLMSAEIDNKNHKGTAKLIVQAFSHFGSITSTGAQVALKSESAWGTQVAVHQPMEKNQWLGFFGDAIYTFLIQIVNKGVDFDVDGIITKIPNDTFIDKCAESSWKILLNHEQRTRQPENIIVYQNGVLNLDTREFTIDDKAPIKYSHPIHATFRPEIAERVKDSGYHNGMKMLKDLGSVAYNLLNDWFPDDPVAVDLLLTWFGYSMTTNNCQQKFVFMHGATGAGKGSTSQLLCRILGDNNYTNTEYSVLDGGFKLGALHDKLVVVIEECGGSSREHMRRLELLKKITGGERLQVERKYQHPFDDMIVGKFILQSNSAPKYEDDGGAVSERMIALGFEKSYRSKGYVGLPSKAIIKDTVEVSVVEESEQIAEGWATMKTLYRLELHVPDILATLAGCYWMHRKKKKNPFAFKGKSQAIEQGEMMVTEGMNISKMVVKRYFKIDTRCTGEVGMPAPEIAAKQITPAALNELIEWFASDAGVDMPTSGHAFARTVESAIEDVYPGTEKKRRRVGLESEREGVTGSKRKRVWENLVLDEEAFDEVMPLFEDYGEWMGRLKFLSEYLALYSPIIEEKRGSLIHMF